MADSLIQRLKEHPAFDPPQYYTQVVPGMPMGKDKVAVRCVFHEDQHPSLSIDLVSGKWYCHAGCGQGDVLDFEAKIRGTTVKDRSFLSALAKLCGFKNHDSPALKRQLKFSIEKLAKQKKLPVEAFLGIHATEVKKEDGTIEICFPMVDAAGKLVGHRRRFAVGKPRTNKGGKLGLMVPRNFDRNNSQFFICEGETDLAAAVHIGINAVAIPGTGKCISMLVDVAMGLKVAGVIIICDADGPGRMGSKKIAHKMVLAGVETRIWEPPKQGTDLRDWVIAGGSADQLRRQIGTLKPIKIADSDSTYTPESASANEDDREPTSAMLARDFLNIIKRRDDFIAFKYYRGEHFQYTGRAWYPMPMAEIRAEIWKFSEPFFIRSGPSKTKIGNIIEGINAEVIVDSEPDMPFWLNDNGKKEVIPIAPGRYIALENGLLDTHNRQMIEPSPLFFHRNHIPIVYDIDAKCLKWDAFVDQIFQGDYERTALLQEFFGYCFLPDNRYQRFVMMQGEGANGKSQVIDVLTAMLGTENVAAVPLDQFGDRFGLLPTIGKLLNVCGDVPELDRIAEGYIKAFTSGDYITVDRKHIAPLTTKPITKLILACNNLPRFHDRSQGIWRRMILIPFNYTVPKDERITNIGLRIFAAEAPGILNWSLVGMDRLLDAAEFSSSVAVDEAQRQYQIECNPAEAFLDESIVTDSEGKISKKSLYGKYKTWCNENGFYPLNSAHFGRHVKTKFRRLRPGKVYEHGTGEYLNGYFGIEWASLAKDKQRTLDV